MTLLPPEGWPAGGSGSSTATVGDLPRLLSDGDDVAPSTSRRPDLPARPSQSSARRRRRRRRRTSAAARPPVAELALAAAAVLAASWPWTSVFAGRGWTGATPRPADGAVAWSGIAGPLLVVTVVAVLTVVGLRRAWWLVAALVATATSLLTAAVLLFSGSGIPYLPGSDAWRGTWDGTVHGWAYLLTITLPADAAGPVAVTPVVATGIAAAAAALLVDRTRIALLPLLAPLVALLPALAFSAAARASTAGSTVVLLLAMLALAVTRTSRLAATDPGIVRPGAAVEGDGDTPLQVDETGHLLPVGSAGTTSATRGVGRAAFSVPVVVGVTAVAVALAPGLGISDGEDRFDPRTLRHDEVQVDDQISPLSTLKGQLARRPAAPAFTVRVTQPADRLYRVDRVRTAVLTVFDGATWSSDSTYRRADSVLPDADQAEAGPLVEQTVLLSGLAGPYLPSAGRALRVDDAGPVGVDRATGVLVTAEETLAGLEYRVTSRAIAHGDRLTRLTPAAGPAQALDLPDRPDWIPEALQAGGAATAGTGTLQQLKNIETYLRSRPYYLAAPSGHSYFRIKRILIGKEGDDAGYAEQRASAFAVLARALGVPARVSVGYLLRTPEPDGSFTVTSEDIHAWPEVNVDGVGWVAFDPTGAARTPPLMRPQKNAQPQGADNSQEQAPDADVPPVLFDQPDPAAPDPGPESWLQRLRRYATWLVSTVLAFALATAVAKAVRRRVRRLRGSPSRRVLGAWHEVVDRLTELGLRPSAAQTPDDVVRALGSRLPDAAWASLPPLTAHVAHALYAPSEPPADAVSQSWEQARRARRDLAATRGVHRRLLAIADPRPLLPASWSGRLGAAATLEPPTSTSVPDSAPVHLLAGSPR